MSKITIENLSILLSQQPENTLVTLKSRNTHNGLNKKPLDSTSGKGENPYYKSSELVKVSKTEGRINFDWSAERKQDLNDDNYKATKSAGLRVGGLTVTPNGKQAISMVGAKTSEVEWYVGDTKLTKEEEADIVLPYKPIKKASVGNTDTDNTRLIYVENIYWIEIGGKRYDLK